MSANLEHVVQFYDDDNDLIFEVARAMCVTLDQGYAVLCVATPAHRRALEQQLTARGVDVPVVYGEGRLVCLDAAKTLSRITVDDAPDVALFAGVVGVVIDALAASFRRVWVFGELVALMCDNGNARGALKLEKLWASFVESRPVFLHCAYPSRAFASQEHREEFLAICEAHSRVMHRDSKLARSYREQARGQDLDSERGAAEESR